MRKVLPLATPAVKSHSKYAHIFLILGAHEDNYSSWPDLDGQLYVPDEYRVLPTDHMMMEMHTNIPNLFSFKIEREVAINIGNGIIGFIKYAIDNEYYICCELEVKHILAYRFDILGYQEPLLYGYDDEKKEVYFADIDMDGTCINGTASYSEIIKAVGNKSNWITFPKNNQGLMILCIKYRDAIESTKLV